MRGQALSGKRKTAWLTSVSILFFRKPVLRWAMVGMASPSASSPPRSSGIHSWGARIATPTCSVSVADALVWLPELQRARNEFGTALGHISTAPSSLRAFVALTDHAAQGLPPLHQHWLAKWPSELYRFRLSRNYPLFRRFGFRRDFGFLRQARAGSVGDSCAQPLVVRGSRADDHHALVRDDIFADVLAVIPAAHFDHDHHLAQLAVNLHITQADDIIRLRYVEIDGQLRKVMVVIKMRGGNYSKDIREYVITDKGVVVIRPRSTDYEGLSTGIPNRTGPRLAQETEVAPEPKATK